MFLDGWVRDFPFERGLRLSRQGRQRLRLVRPEARHPGLVCAGTPADGDFVPPELDGLNYSRAAFSSVTSSTVATATP